MKRLQIMFIACFLLFISGMGIMTLGNHREVSTTEGRKMVQFPDLEYQKLLDVEYLNQISDAWDDQVTGRETMVKSYYQMVTKGLLQKYAGTTVIGRDGQLFQEPEVIGDEKEYEKEVIRCAKVINREAEKITATGAKFIYINYPRKDVVESEYLPDWYLDSKADYEKYIAILRKHISDNVIFLDGAEIFQGKKYDCYYKTDHHVNFRGQIDIYAKLMELVQKDYPGIEKKSLSDYSLTEKVVDGSFRRKIGYCTPEEKEELNVRPNFSLKYKRNSKTKLFGGGDTYASAFMGGDYADTMVTRKDCKIPEILISGSSYTNSLEALCVASFGKMHSLDYRYHTSKKSLADYAKEEKPAYVVYIPNQSDKHFCYDTFKLHLGL